MPVVNVYNTSVTTENISRFELLAWVNACLQSNLTKIEEMGTGAAYAQLTDFLFPGQIQLRKIRWNSRSEVDWMNNWRVVQQSWKELGVAKPVPVQSLLKSKFQDNFEFLQWFKRFFDANYDGHEYDPLGARNHEEFPATLPGGKASANKLAGVSSAPAPPPPPQQRSTRHHSTMAGLLNRSVTNPPSRQPPTATGARAQAQSHATTRVTSGQKSSAPPSNATASKLKEENNGLRGQISELEKDVSHAVAERNFYFGKLRTIEVMCEKANSGAVETLSVKTLLEVLYAEGEEAAAAAAEAGANDNGVAGAGAVPDLVANHDAPKEGKESNGVEEKRISPVPMGDVQPAADAAHPATHQPVSQPQSEPIVSPPTMDGESYASGDIGMDEAFILAPDSDDTDLLNKTHDIINTTQQSHPNGAIIDGMGGEGRRSGDVTNGQEDEPLISLESPDGGDPLNKTHTVSPKVDAECTKKKATATPLDDSETF